MAQTQTHHLEFGDGVVRKRYASWNRDEHDREWATLRFLNCHAPGLAPRPIARETEDGAPVVVMSRLPGKPLGQGKATPTQTTAMTAAYRQLFDVPPGPGLKHRDEHPAAFLAVTADWMVESSHADLSRCQDPTVVRAAQRAAIRWLEQAPTRLGEIIDPVPAQGDGNVANMIWDGERCCLVDFEAFGVGELTFEVADLVEHASSRLRELLDPEAVIAAFDLSPAQAARVVSYRILLACFWLAMLSPGNKGFERNPPGSVENQATHVLTLLGG